MHYTELIKTPEYWTAKIQIDLYNKVEEYMKIHHLNRTQLAAKLGVSKGYISQILNGDFDHRLSKLVQLALSIGMVPDLKFNPLDSLNRSSELTAEEAQNEIYKLSQLAGLNVMICTASSDEDTRKLRSSGRIVSSRCLKLLTA